MKTVFSVKPKAEQGKNISRLIDSIEEYIL